MTFLVTSHQHLPVSLVFALYFQTHTHNHNTHRHAYKHRPTHPVLYVNSVTINFGLSIRLHSVSVSLCLGSWAQIPAGEKLSPTEVRSNQSEQDRLKQIWYNNCKPFLRDFKLSKVFLVSFKIWHNSNLIVSTYHRLVFPILNELLNTKCKMDD